MEGRQQWKAEIWVGIAREGREREGKTAGEIEGGERETEKSCRRVNVFHQISFRR